MSAVHTLASVNERIGDLEAISRQREFTDAEIDEFIDLIRQWRALDRQHKRKRAFDMPRINKFLENVWRIA